MTKLFALGALVAGVVAIARAANRRAAASRQQRDIDASFDYGDLDEPVVVSEEVVVVEAIPYEIDMELIPADELIGEQPQDQSQAGQASQGEPPFATPGRGVGPR